jgi:hypothetical protein
MRWNAFQNNSTRLKTFSVGLVKDRAYGLHFLVMGMDLEDYLCGSPTVNNCQFVRIKIVLGQDHSAFGFTSAEDLGWASFNWCPSVSNWRGQR